MKRYCEYATYLLSTMFIVDFGLMLYSMFFAPYGYAGLGYVLIDFLPLFLPALVFSILILGTYWLKGWKLKKPSEIAFVYILNISFAAKIILSILDFLGIHVWGAF